MPRKHKKTNKYLKRKRKRTFKGGKRFSRLKKAGAFLGRKRIKPFKSKSSVTPNLTNRGRPPAVYASEEKAIVGREKGNLSRSNSQVFQHDDREGQERLSPGSDERTRFPGLQAASPRHGSREWCQRRYRCPPCPKKK